MMRTLFIASLLAACGKSANEAPKGASTPLPALGVKIELPQGWHVVDRGMIHDEPEYQIQYGEESSPSFEISWCTRGAAQDNVADFYKQDDVCRHAEKDGKQETLPSGGFRVDCTIEAFGEHLHYEASAIKVDDKLVRCWHQATKPSAEQEAILASLRR